MPRSLLEGNIKTTALAVDPGDIEAITLSELEDGKDLSSALMRQGYRFSATGSDTLSEPALDDSSNAGSYGASNYEFNATAFRYREQSGKADPDQDIAIEVFAGKGTLVRIVERSGQSSGNPWSAEDEYRTGLVLLDDRQQPTELTGYEKFIQPGTVQSGGIVDGVVASSGGGGGGGGS